MASGGTIMRASTKAIQSRNTTKTPHNENKRKVRPVQLAKIQPTSMKNKMWHNWLTEENYL
jgi:hypothetical protein